MYYQLAVLYVTLLFLAVQIVVNFLTYRKLKRALATIGYREPARGEVTVELFDKHGELKSRFVRRIIDIPQDGAYVDSDHVRYTLRPYASVRYSRFIYIEVPSPE